jgi:hypothetical protein
MLAGTGTVGTGVTLSGGTVNLGTGGTISGAVATTGGTWSGAGSVTGGINANSGTFTVNGTTGGGVLTVASGATLAGTGTVGTGVTLSGGTVNMGTGGTISGALEATGGTWSGTGTVAGLVTSSGIFTVGTGGSLAATTGIDVATGGTLIVHGTTTGGAVAVTSGATLKGTGTIANATTIQSGATHSPGTSPGLQIFTNDLIYANGSFFEWELNGNTADPLLRGVVVGDGFDGVNVNGSGVLTINTTVTANLKFTGVQWTDSFWNTSQSWLVFDNANSPASFSTPGIFSLTNVGLDSTSAELLASRGVFSWGQVSTDVYLNYTAVPEPTSIVGAVILGGAWVSRRSYKKSRRSEKPKRA